MIEVVCADTYNMRRRFYAFPHLLYKNDPFWREPAIWGGYRMLSSRHNALLMAPHALLMALENGRTIARVLTGKGYFALFDACPRLDAVERLMEEVVHRQRQWGSTHLEGPIAPCAVDIGGGVLVEGFEEMPMFVYRNAPYYGEYLEKAGLIKERDELIYRVSMGHFHVKRYHQAASWAIARYGLILEDGAQAGPRTLSCAIAQVMKVDEVTCQHLVAEMLPYLGRGLCPVVRTVDGKAVGFLLSLRERQARVRVGMLWIDEAWRGRGVLCVLMDALRDGLQKAGLHELDAAVIWEDNMPSRRCVEMAGGELIQRLRRYKAEI